VGLAAGLFVVYAIFAFVVPQTPARMELHQAPLMHDWALWRLVDGLPTPTSPGMVAALVAGVTVAAFLLYGAGIALCWRRPPTRGALALVLATSAAFFCMIALAPPTQSSDVFDYMLTGRVAAVHHQNPYVAVPDRFPDDPFYPYASQRNTKHPDIKLPTWMYLNVAWAKLGGDSPVRALLVYRLGFLLCNLAALALITLLLARWRPQATVAGALTYGWHPIVVFHGQGKVDTVMVLLLVLAAGLVLSNRRILGAVVLTLSALVKLITLPLLAAHLVATLVSERRRVTVAAAVAAVATAAIVYAPFVQSGGGLITHHLGLLGLAGSSLPGPARIAGVTAAAALTAAIGLRAGRRLEWTLVGWTVLVLLFGAVLTRLALSWYLLTLVALVALSGRWWLTLPAWAITLSSFLFDMWAGASSRAFRLPELYAGPRLVLYLIPLAVCATALAAVTLRRARRTTACAEAARRSALPTAPMAA
jgi:hypothetical protein